MSEIASRSNRPNRMKIEREQRARHPQRAEAYLRWATTANKGRGAMVKLSQDLGIALGTLHWWKREDRWEQRWIDDIQGAKLRMVQEGEAVLLTALRPAMERLGQIAVSGSDRDAVAAVKVFAAILGIDQSKAVNLNLTTINPTLIAEAKEASTGEMKKLLAEIGQTNIEGARVVKRRSS